MKLRDYLFTYSWSDLAPIQELRDAWVKGYLACGVLGLFLVRSDEFGMAFVVPAMMGNYPAYLLGLWWQEKQRPGAISENALMVKQLRFLAALFSICASVAMANFVIP